ncbi:MerR family transcriptional regulator [Brevibacillus migulae]|uniref:MerR family transcriptional regulator n=1 Tax=Brevibacillus migulae TaxID=1644114 RepID=UPI0014314FDD|nr:MerR family transcriptional regulator [Brevibacillus migulae]
MENALTIQQVAERTGLTVHTLRYYERVGLMDHVARASNGHRRYTENDLDWISFLQCLRATNMPIAEMKQFFNLAQLGKTNYTERRQLLELHAKRMRDQLEQIQKTMAYLDKKVAYYRKKESELLQQTGELRTQ